MDLNGQNLDPTATASIGALVSDPSTTESLANNYNTGLSAGRGLLNSQDNFDKQLGYKSAATDAIRSRYQSNYGKMEDEIKLSNVRNAGADNLRRLAVASSAASQEVQLNSQKALLKWKIDQQNKKARGAVLGTVLGIVGGVVGGVVAGAGSFGIGAAGGAAAGYAAGQGIGQAYGSAND